MLQVDAFRSGSQILDQHRSCFRPIGGPEFIAMLFGVRKEEDALSGCDKLIEFIIWLVVICVAALMALFSLVGLIALVRDRATRVAPLVLSWVFVFPAILVSEVNFVEGFDVAHVGWHVFASAQSGLAVAWALLGSATYARNTLRFAWHLTTVQLIAIGAVVVLLARLPGEGQSVTILRSFSVAFGVSTLVSLIGARGKHFSWWVFLVIAVLLWFGA